MQFDLLFCFQYTVLFRAGAVHSVSQSIEATPVDSTESSFDTYRSPPRPLPYDDPRFSPPARDWLRHESPSHSPEESEPLRANGDDEEMETPSRIDKASKTNYDTKMKICSSAYGDKVPPKGHGNYFSYFSPSAEDEDVCPTCLEGIIIVFLHFYLHYIGDLHYIFIFILYLNLLKYGMW